MPELAVLRALLPEGVALGLPSAAPVLMPAEVPGAMVPARLAEFTAGRSAARAAMAALGLPPAAIPMGPDRAPEWPAGLTGSITHCAGLCLAVMAPATRWAGLGLDAEPLAPLAPDLAPTILAPGEQAPGLLEAFVAKEAAYKAQYALTRSLFDFHTLRLDWQGTAFRARFTRPVPPFASGDALSGQLLRTGGHLMALVAIAA